VLSALLLGGSLLLLGAGLLVFALRAHGVDLVKLQVAGSIARARRAVGGDAAGVGKAIHADFFLLVGYTAGAAIACGMGRRIFWRPAGQRASAFGVWLAIAAGALNVVQDVLMLQVLPHVDRHGTWILRCIQALSFAKFAVLVPAGVVAVCAWTVGPVRLLHRAKKRAWPPAVPDGREPPFPEEDPKAWPPEDDPKQVIPPPMVLQHEVRAETDARSTASGAKEHEEQAAAATPERKDGAAGHWEQDFRVPPGRPPADIGICVSGGGVRSGSVALGALQALRQEKQLLQASYLVSVSGGGYMAGAFQLALADPDRSVLDLPRGVKFPATSATPGDVFAPGSVEEDHVRRHSSYLSDGAKQWLVALGVILRGLISSLVVIGLAVTAVGLAIGRFYRSTRIANILTLQPRFLVADQRKPIGEVLAKFQAKCSVPHATAPVCFVHSAAPAFPTPRPGVVIALVVAGGLTAAAYLAQVIWTSSSGHTARVASWTKALGALTLLFAVIGAFVPTLVWVSAWITWHTGWKTTPGTVATTGSITVVLAYLGTLAGTLWRNKKSISSGLGRITSLFSKGGTAQVVPYSMAQMLLIWLCLVILCLVLFLVSGWVAASGADRSPWSLFPVVALILGAILVDQTWMSLHPFYRARLASAFAVRRSADAPYEAIPYNYEIETKLSQFAKPVPDFPKVIFAAAANLTGQDRTPPGRRAVSFTMADDYVGGPQIGWVPTAALEDLVSNHLRRDLTVQAAVAISGAAFASAMGAQTRFYELFLTLSNARLGAWLPNPYFVWLKSSKTDDWTIPGLPSRRRLSYFAREIFGLHPSTGRLVLCTDGGHYENLGLVELLRHRCRLIYCIDASGDSPPLATTMAQAITLAKEELGVTITLHQPLDLVPGGARPLSPSPLASLSARLSRSLICVGDITYPEGAGVPASWERKGKLIVAKAGLTWDKEFPYELLSYAVDDPAFPRDSTSDQWFNAGQFDGYRGLGWELGRRAAKAARDAHVIDAAGVPVP